jgi:hypothetical protein
MATASRATNKHDVEIARLRSHGETLRALANRGGWALVVAASALPVWMLHGVVQPLAGRNTHVDASFVISLTVVVSVVVNVAQGALAFSRQSELRRLRRRISDLEPSLIREVVQ